MTLHAAGRRTSLRRRLSRAATAVAAAAAAVVAVVPLAAPAGAVTLPMPATPRFVTPAEKTVPYEPQTTCTSTIGAGTAWFARMAVRTYPGSTNMGILRACGSGGQSEHKEGRAFDWGVDARVAREGAMATAMHKWLLKDDAEIARRLGIMYIIFNDRILSVYRLQDGWRPYVHASCRGRALSQCSPTLRHVDHVHYSFSRAGGAGRTSFWQGPDAVAPSGKGLALLQDSLAGVRSSAGA
ncbi:hypothetical protein [Vallicoccus soli]|uniref:ARB-07466-like C-terminal domain-containing protein n=1 Tax=Vallicoccus soli TaxID=2339232 RepID=A0A3A3ZAI3_9ACTN|nr:hypothetical protein [Vallicoccus soli]RJK98096.1 hypothetical protein D5H78_03970 [Vallicoccus soli]